MVDYDHEPFDTRRASRSLRLSRCQRRSKEGGHVARRVTIAMMDSLDIVGITADEFQRWKNMGVWNQVSWNLEIDYCQ